MLPDLLSALLRKMKVEALLADGVYDIRRVYAEAERRGIGDVRIPPKTGAKE